MLFRSEGQELEHPLLNRSIQTAQKRVEQHNFQARKRTLEYDDVMNKQRAIVYGFRNEIINGDDVRDRLMDIMEEVVLAKVEEFTSKDVELAEWNLRGLADWVQNNFLGKVVNNVSRRPLWVEQFAEERGRLQHLIDRGVMSGDQRDLKEVLSGNCTLQTHVNADAAWQVVVDAIAHFSH